MLGPRGWTWRAAGASLFVGLVVGRSTTAHAFPSSRLVYSRGPGAETCPEEDSLRKEVAQRLGYDPFFVWAERTIVARIEREGSGLRATVQLLDAAGLVRGSRSLASPSSDCTELAKSVALVISIGIDPEHAGFEARAEVRKEPQAAPPEPPRPPSEAPVTSPAPPDRPPDAPGRTSSTPRVEPQAGAGAWTGIGLAPRPSFGLAAFAGLGWGPVALHVEGRNGFASGDDVEAALLTVSAVPCVRLRPVFACATGSWGELRAEGARSATARYLAIGARAGFDLFVFRQLFVRTHLDAAFPLDRTIVQVNGRPAWQLPVLSGALGIEASLQFP